MRKWLPWLGLGTIVLLVWSSSSKAETSRGITLTDTEIKLSNWSEWMAWGPGAVAAAFHDGAQTGDQVLAHVMRRLFPTHQWPPAPDDPIVESWREMVHGLNRSLLRSDDDELDNVIPMHR